MIVVFKTGRSPSKDLARRSILAPVTQLQRLKSAAGI